MKFELKLVGGMKTINRINTRFRNMEQAAVDAGPAWLHVAEILYQIENAIFNSQGRRGGGSWKQDSPEWLARKAADGLDLRIGHATHALRDSVTFPDAPGQVLDIGLDRMRFGSDLPYAATMQRNRPFIKLTAFDKMRIRKEMRDHFIRAWNEGVVR